MPRTMHPFLAALRSGHAGKVVSATDAVRLIREGDTVATGGFVGIGFAEGIAVALEEFWLSAEQRAVPGRRQARQSYPGLCRRAGRRPHARAQPPWP